MTKSENERSGRNVLANCIVICIATVITLTFLAVVSVTAAAEEPVEVRVSVPEEIKEGEIFDVTIDIDEVTDADIEALVAERAREMKSGIKNFAAGGAFALLLSSVIGF